MTTSDLIKDLKRHARKAAEEAGYNPDYFERQIQQESGFNPEAHNEGSNASGIAQIIPKWHPGVDVWNPYESLTYAAQLMRSYYNKFGSYPKALAAYNWGSGNVGGGYWDGEDHEPWDGRRKTLPEETRHYLDVILGKDWDTLSDEKQGSILVVTENGLRLRTYPSVTSSTILTTLPAGAKVKSVDEYSWRQVEYQGKQGWVAANYLEQVTDAGNGEPKAMQFDPATPTEFQVQNWTCAIRTTMWLLKSIGIQITAAEAQDAMVPRYVTSDDGLLDGTGAGIVEYLRNVHGVAAYNIPEASYQQIHELAGKLPIGIGGHNWGGSFLGHWSAVRGANEQGIILANPARGTTYGQLQLSEHAWNWRSPFSAVVVTGFA